MLIQFTCTRMLMYIVNDKNCQVTMVVLKTLAFLKTFKTSLVQLIFE